LDELKKGRSKLKKKQRTIKKPKIKPKKEKKKKKKKKKKQKTLSGESDGARAGRMELHGSPASKSILRTEADLDKIKLEKTH